MLNRFFVEKKVLTFLCIILLVFMTGCSNSDSEQKENAPNQETQMNTTSPSSNSLEADKDLQAQLEAEKGIESVMIQVVGGAKSVVNADIVINNAQTLSPDEAIQRYGKMIKEKYPDRSVDIMIIKDDKVVKQDTLK